MNLKNLYPGRMVSSVYEMDWEKLALTYRGVIFDIDNTLVTHGAPANEKAKKLFAHLHELGFATCLISNNQEPRVKPFADAVQSMYIYDAHKPSTKNYEKAMERMHTDKKNTIFIGDQMFTDVFGANRTGIPSIMVKKIHWKEEIQIVLKRRLEAIVLIGYRNFRKKHRSIFENREEKK